MTTKISIRQHENIARQRDALDQKLDEALRDTFPASDPIALMLPPQEEAEEVEHEKPHTPAD